MALRDLKNWAVYARRLKSALLDPTVDEAELEETLRQARERAPVPVLWLLGKTQAGKTSIIRALTGSDSAEIGNGYQPCTRTACLYDFPETAPVVRFLDTRGLGEIAYDPEEDIRYCESHANLVLAVMKIADFDQQAVVDVLRAVRRRHPDWPVLLVLTGLHELYEPGGEHVQPYPFDDESGFGALPDDLQRALVRQREVLDSLDGRGAKAWVAVDLTQPEDGYTPTNYGIEALWRAIEDVSTLGLERQLRGDESVRDVYARSAHQHIVGHAVTAAALGALPVVDLVAVSGVQAKLLHALSNIYDQCWDRRTTTEFVSLLGASVATGLVARMVGKSVVKFIPGFGQSVGAVWGASTSGTATYALGKAAVYFFSQRNAGASVDARALRKVYAEALDSGTAMLRERFGRTRK